MHKSVQSRECDLQIRLFKITFRITWYDYIFKNVRVAKNVHLVALGAKMIFVSLIMVPYLL